MGEYLSTPKKDKNPIDGQNAQVFFMNNTFIIAAIWRSRYARMEQDNGRRARDSLGCH
jgi:hypothetical protein